MMKKIVCLSVAVALVAVMATSGFAGIVGTATLVKDPGNGIPFLAPEAGLGSPWVSYQLSVAGTDGQAIGAVDVSITGAKLHQRWTDPDFDGVTNPTANGAASDGRGDSHLTAPAGSPFGAGPSETNTLAGSPLVSTPGTTEYGLGDLSGAWAILNPTTNNNIAYIVVNKNDLPNITITVKSATPAGDALPTLFAADFFVPEPSSMALIGLSFLGGLGFVRRRLG